MLTSENLRVFVNSPGTNGPEEWEEMLEEFCRIIAAAGTLADEAQREGQWDGPEPTDQGTPDGETYACWQSAMAARRRWELLTGRKWGAP